MLKFSADYVGVMKATVEKEMGATAIFMQGATGDQSVSQGTNSGYQGVGQALGREVIKLASSLTPAEPAKPSLVLKEDRFKFASRIDLVQSRHPRRLFVRVLPGAHPELRGRVRGRRPAPPHGGHAEWRHCPGRRFGRILQQPLDTLERASTGEATCSSSAIATVITSTSRPLKRWRRGDMARTIPVSPAAVGSRGTNHEYRAPLDLPDARQD